MLCPAAAEQKQAQKSARHPGKSLCLFYLFGQERIQRAGAGWIATAWTGGASKGAKPLWLWVSNRGEQHPCWHTILLAKSSVLYLLRPLTLERGCPTPDKPFSVAAEQADFVGSKIHKMKDLP